jgi:hypothetical protein
MRIGKTFIGTAALGLALMCAGAIPEFGQAPEFKGKVHDLGRSGDPLALRMQAAAREHGREPGEGLYFTGYAFTAHQAVHMGEDRDEGTPYSIGIRGDGIRIRRARDRNRSSGYSMRTAESRRAPVGLVLLQRLAGRSGEILDAQIIDLDRVYEFEEVPLYWLGSVNNPDSLEFLGEAFDAGLRSLRKTLVFVIGMHAGSEAPAFLKTVALGDYDLEVRKGAVFWIGNRPGSLGILRDIRRKADETELQKQVVFALSLSDDPDAVREMIEIARKDGRREVRKNAIFWLGQKASAQAADALEDMVNRSGEDEDVKKSAVFAISRLPKDKSIPLLISIAKTNPSTSVRKNAIFWLGQSGEEEALDFFEEILLKR